MVESAWKRFTATASDSSAITTKADPLSPRVLGAFKDDVAKALRRHRYAPRTIKLYVNMLAKVQIFLAWRRTTLAKAGVDDILDYAATLPFTYASQNRLKSALKAYWRHCHKRPEPTPAEAIRVPTKPRQVYRGLVGPEEARALIASARSINGIEGQAAAALAYYAALRCLEIASLPMSADHGDYLSVMGKGAQPRVVPVHAELRAILDEWRAHRVNRPVPWEQTQGKLSPWLFPGRIAQGHVSTMTVNNWIKLGGVGAGLGKITPHQLRYTAGAVMYEATNDLRSTGTFLGHSPSSSAITWGYTRTTDRALKALAESL